MADCFEKSELTSIHRKKISYLSFGINQFGNNATVHSILPFYLKRARSILLEANGDTGYSGDIILKVSHKPEYKSAQIKKAEADLAFIEEHLANCSVNQVNEYNEIKDLLNKTK
ncbi:hypothetical protein AB3N58_16215 [Leptospira sp. WS60.C2]